MNFSKYKAMSFDCYGTLIDWETGILTQLQAWAKQQKLQVSNTKLIELFGQHERAVQAETPAEIYPKILMKVHQRIARSLQCQSTENEAIAFGHSVGDWPVFPDTVEALKKLSRHYQLFILSNVDRNTFQKTNEKLGIVFDGVVTAQDVGSYKPDPKNFIAIKQCVADAGIAAEALLHVGESIYHDVIPGTDANLDTAWIDRQLDNPNATRASGAIDTKIKPTITLGSMEHLANIAIS